MLFSFGDRLFPFTQSNLVTWTSLFAFSFFSLVCLLSIWKVCNLFLDVRMVSVVLYKINFNLNLFIYYPHLLDLWITEMDTLLRNNMEKPVQSVSRVTQLCSTLCDPMDCSTPGFPVHHQFQKPAQTHVHGVGDEPSHPLSPSPPAFNLSQHQGLL